MADRQIWYLFTFSKLGFDIEARKFDAKYGTQIVVGAEYDANDVFVQYVTANIEDVKVGDYVYSYDAVTGKIAFNPVTDVFVRKSNHLNYLAIADENGSIQVIETTDGHPFWVVTDEPDLSRAAGDYSDGFYHGILEISADAYWVEAKDLREGDVLLGANGELSTLVGKERVEYPEVVTVYNFSVDGNHDYFVIAEGEYGRSCILVRNAKYINEPELPPREVVNKDGVTVTHYTNDHKPPHLHVYGEGRPTRIGENGKPIRAFYGFL